MTKPVPANLNSLWADLLIEQFCRHGIRHFCISPGSRSGPLVAAVARRPELMPLVHYDERGAAFHALGVARATGRPAVGITTSGSAAANAWPALIEASYSRVPLILLTADRPPELRDTGANQAIDQVKFFGHHVRWQFDLPCPTTAILPQMVLNTAAQAVYQSLREPRGPVHLNCMFREPLDPAPDGRDYSGYLAPINDWLRQDVPYGRRALPAPSVPEPQTLDVVLQRLRGTERGVVVVGRLDHEGDAVAAAGLADHLGWPLLPDVTSGLRLGGGKSGVPFYDLSLTAERFAASHVPDAVLHFGDPPTSKRLAALLQQVRGGTIQVKAHPVRQDPLHHVAFSVEASVTSFARALAERTGRTSAGPWLAGWREVSDRVADLLRNRFAGEQQLSEPLLAHLVSGQMGEGHGLFLGNSMPLRDMDMYGDAAGSPVSVFANRGASGIDGGIATAAGCAAGLGRPTTAVLGDLSALHDLNSLSLASSGETPLALVIVNNHGGGIFHFLPIANHRTIFEKYFGTPHRFTFRDASAMFGLEYAAPASVSELVATHRAALTGQRAAVIEVTTDREENVAVHRSLEDAVRKALA